MNSEFSEFSIALFFIIGSVIFALGGVITAFLLRPDRPNAEKLTTYECGEETVGSAWGQFNIRFYIIALIFILFEVELAFLFPWSVVFGSQQYMEQTNGLWGWFVLAEVFLFVLILFLGLAYAWRKGFLDWVKPKVEPSDFKTVIPKNLYDNINEKYAKK